MTPVPKIDIDALKARISLEDMIERCGLELTKHGREWERLCPFHSEKTPSFKVTPAKQLYFCAGCASGGDHIQFLRDYYGLGFKDAAAKLAELTGGTLSANDDAAPARRASKKPDEPPKWIRGVAPINAPPCPPTLRMYRDGEWTDQPWVAAWPYRNRDGELLGYTCRVEFTKPDGKIGKDVLPVTWQINTRTGVAEWRPGAMDKPRPLYGAELLDATLESNVIVVEGEKAADAARRLLAEYAVVVVTWAGGCKAVDHTDWSLLAGRKVVGWPDCDSQADRAGQVRAYADQPGMVAMLRIAELVAAQGASMRIVAVPEPGHLADGWDLADAEAEGWDGQRVMAYLRDMLATPDAIRARAEPSASIDEPQATEAPDHGPAGPDPDDIPGPPADERGRAKKDRKPPPRPSDVEDHLPVRALGYDRGRYYYLSGQQRQVHEYAKGDHTANGLLQLAPLGFWSELFAYGAPMKGEHWLAATDALMRKCERKGIFDPVTLRGRGCWTDQGRMVLNLGNRTLVDGAERELTDTDSHFIYEAGTKMAGPHGTPLSVGEARRVLDIAKRFNWEMPASAALLAGWIVLAPLCGALRWRPHVWVTGGSGTGKSTVLEQFIGPLLAGTELRFQGNSTEAGIRQSLRADARPVMIDESEANDERAEVRIQNILSLIRQTSSESEARTTKGTQAGRALEFHIRSMFCLASIQVSIKNQADHNRMSVLGLYGMEKVAADDRDAHQDKWLETAQMLADLRDQPDFAPRLMARSLAMHGVIEANMRTLTRVAAREFRSQRLGDQYGTLLAGAATLLYDHPISEEGALKFIRLFDWATFHEAAREDESMGALAAILQIMVQVDLDRTKEMRNVGELVQIVIDNQTDAGVSPSEAIITLGRMGLKVRRPLMADHGALVVANNAARLSRDLKGQPWGPDWKSYLRRLPGAKATAVPIRFGPGFIQRATEIPIPVVLPSIEGAG